MRIGMVGLGRTGAGTAGRLVAYAEGFPLLDLVAASLADDPRLERVGGSLEDSGEGRWTVEAAVDAGVPTPAIAAALSTRFASRDPDAFGNRLIAAVRHDPNSRGPEPPDLRGHAVSAPPASAPSA